MATEPAMPPQKSCLMASTVRESLVVGIGIVSDGVVVVVVVNLSCGCSVGKVVVMAEEEEEVLPVVDMDAVVMVDCGG